MLSTSAAAQVSALADPSALAAGRRRYSCRSRWRPGWGRDHSDHPLAWALATLVAGVSPLWVGSIAVVLLYRRTRQELGSIAPPSVRREDEIERGEVLGEAVDKRRRTAREQAREEPAEDLGGFEMAEPVEELETGS